MMRFPDGRLPNPADATGGVQRAPNLRLLASAYRVFPTALGLREAAKTRSWDALVDPPGDAPSSPELPAVTSQNLPTSQMAILRQGKWQVYFHYGQLHASHAQAEALNFEAYFGDADITHDAGTVGYGSPLHTGFYRTGAAHNVPLIDGQSQDRWRPGELVSFAPDRVAARQPQYRPGVSAMRDLKIEGDRLVDVVKIEATSGKAGTVLHLQGQVQIPDEAKPQETGLPYWTNVRRASFKDRAVLHAVFGEIRMRVLVETPGDFTIAFGRSPDMPPESRDSIYIETARSQAEFRTTIEPATSRESRR
jgi:hypothetical protein